MADHENFKFYTDSVSFKTIKRDGEEPEYIVEGYISTSELDRVGDIVTKEALADMVAQIKTGNIKLDIEHEAWLKSPNIVPIGRIVEARLDDKGIWVKAVINQHNSRFKEVWGSLKNGFLDAFSIAYKPIAAVKKVIGEQTVRLLNKVELLNVALTGNPANPECSIQSVMMKSITAIQEEKIPEVGIMAEETIEQAPVAVEAPEVKNLQLEIEELKKTLAEMKNVFDKQNVETAEFKSAVETQNAELKAKLAAAEEALAKPQLKALNEAMPTQAPERKKNVLEYI